MRGRDRVDFQRRLPPHPLDEHGLRETGPGHLMFGILALTIDHLMRLVI